jgi:pSer/pThr/pTyr-binding forkhead associated (FHA) protein
MNAELIVVNGADAGSRYALDRDEFFIGRAPNSSLVLSEPDVSWRHCQIRRQSFKYLVTDLRTSAGTYVNGMRTAERWLEDRDQIGIGKTILMFRSAEGMEADRLSVQRPDTKPVLLAACSLVFLFRALAASVGEAQNGLLQNQILRLIRDLIPTREVPAARNCAPVSTSNIRGMNPALKKGWFGSAMKALSKMRPPGLWVFRSMWVARSAAQLFSVWKKTSVCGCLPTSTC